MREMTEEIHDSIFVKDDDTPVTFFLHSSLTDGQEANLQKKILDYGGDIVFDEEDGAFDCIVVSEEMLPVVRKRYQHSRTVYVEPISFVKKCIRRRVYYHDKPLKKGMGGRPPGQFVTPFTGEDDMHLAEYLALKIPYKEAGGRTGNNVYKLLVSSTDVFPWAARHSWQSWRTRYKNSQERFDRMIDACLKVHPPHPDGKGEYYLDRRQVGIYNHPFRGWNEEEEEEEAVPGQRVEVNRARSRPVPAGPVSINADAVEEDPRTAQRTKTENAQAHGKQRHDDDNEASPELPRQKKQRTAAPQTYHGENNDNNGGEQRSSIDHDYDFDIEQNFMPDFDLSKRPQSRELTLEVGDEAPLNTQATLVGAANGRKSGNNADNQPESNTPTPARVRAARNRERARMEREARMREPQSTAVPPDTQATVVGPSTQVDASHRQPRVQQARQTEATASKQPQRTAARKTAVNLILPPDSPPPRVYAALAPRAPQGRNPADKQSKGPSTEEVRKAFRQDKQQPPPVVKTPDAPYRNTRARSRSVSVEPPQLQPPERKAKKQTAMQPVPEDEAEEDALMEENSVDAVEDALAGGDETQETTVKLEAGLIRMEEDDEEEEELEYDELTIGSSEEDIDDEIRANAQRIRNRPRSALFQTSSSPFRSTHESILLTPEHASTLNAALPFAHHQLPSTPARRLFSASYASNVSGSVSRVKKEETESSESNFPVSGTQARHEKERRIDQSKKRPYEPPSMTRAAAAINKQPSRPARR